MMSIVMEEKEMKALAAQLAKNIKTEKDLSDFSKLLRKMTVEAALGAEMEEHLGYSKHSPEGHNSGNSRNGHSSKALKGDHGEVQIEVPRDRNSTFEPQIIRKGQTRLTEFDDQILSLYAKGMTTRDIVATFKEMYGADVSATLISKVTESVLEKVQEWQTRPLDEVYPVVYLDCLVVKIRQDNRVIKKAVYIVLGINLEGRKEILGLWLSENEGAKFWLSILTELENRGVKDIFIACVDGLKGFPEAVNTAFPNTKVQLCIVHMIRGSLRFVTWKDKKQVAADLKKIYSSVTEEEAARALKQFGDSWDNKYPAIAKSWTEHWPNLITLFDYPVAIRKIIYTTNAIESLNSVIRKTIKNRKIFPHDQSAMKIIWLAIQSASKTWTMPLQYWNLALNRFMIEYQGRIPKGF